MLGDCSVDLSTVSARDLATELLARLRRGDADHDSSAPLDLLAVLSMETEFRTDAFDNRFSRERASAMFHKVDSHLVSGALRLEGATVVELGCGSVNPLGNLLVHVLAGARRCMGVDLELPQDMPAAVRGLARIAGYLLTDPAGVVGSYPLTREQVAQRLTGFDLAKLRAGDPLGIDSLRLTVKQERAESLSFETGAADYVYSISFLEHVPDPDAVLTEVARITRPGGVGVHTIDGTDHFRYEEPDRHALAFLREETTERMVHGSNRIRPLQFAELWARHGFEVLAQEVHERVDVPDELRARFVEPFRSMSRELLEAVSVSVHVRRIQ